MSSRQAVDYTSAEKYPPIHVTSTEKYPPKYFHQRASQSKVTSTEKYSPESSSQAVASFIGYSPESRLSRRQTVDPIPAPEFRSISISDELYPETIGRSDFPGLDGLSVYAFMKDLKGPPQPKRKKLLDHWDMSSPPQPKRKNLLDHWDTSSPPQPKRKTWLDPITPPQPKRKNEVLTDIKNGWGEHVKVRTLPKYHPNKKLLENRMAISTLRDVMNRLQLCIRSLSIQASYSDDPLSAKLQTPENCEFYLDFWKSLSGTSFFIDIQRRRGDHLTANRYIRQLIDASKEFDETCSSNIPFDRSFNRQQLQKLEVFLNKAINNNADWNIPETPEKLANNAVDKVHALLESKRLDARKRGLEQLADMTDLNRTMSQTAKAASLVVLSGLSPLAETWEKASYIQDVIIRLILQKEFQDDDQVFALSGTEMKCDKIKPFLPPAESMSRNRPRYYEEFMSELFLLALKILVQSLEVASCFQDEQDEFRLFHFVKQYVTNSMDRTLKQCIARVNRGSPASHSLCIGYLACKALRLFATSDPYLRKCVKEDKIFRGFILEAVFVGKASHSLLKMESEKLWLTIYGEAAF
jgi:hypothetical protein